MIIMIVMITRCVELTFVFFFFACHTIHAVMVNNTDLSPINFDKLIVVIHCHRCCCTTFWHFVISFRCHVLVFCVRYTLVFYPFPFFSMKLKRQKKITFERQIKQQQMYWKKIYHDAIKHWIRAHTHRESLIKWMARILASWSLMMFYISGLIANYQTWNYKQTKPINCVTNNICFCFYVDKFFIWWWWW